MRPPARHLGGLFRQPAGAVAVRTRLPLYVYFSGLLVNIAGGIVWLSWGQASAANFIYYQALCFALAAAIWCGLEAAAAGRATSRPWRGGMPTYHHLAIL